MQIDQSSIEITWFPVHLAAQDLQNQEFLYFAYYIKYKQSNLQMGTYVYLYLKTSQNFLFYVVPTQYLIIE